MRSTRAIPRALIERSLIVPDLTRNPAEPQAASERWRAATPGHCSLSFSQACQSSRTLVQELAANGATIGQSARWVKSQSSFHVFINEAEEFVSMPNEYIRESPTPCFGILFAPFGQYAQMDQTSTDTTCAPVNRLSGVGTSLVELVSRALAIF